MTVQSSPQRQQPSISPCSGLGAWIARNAYTAGGVTAKLGQALVISSVFAGPEAAAFGAVGEGVGTLAQLGAGAYYAYNGNPLPLANAVASATFGLIKGPTDISHEAMGNAMDASADRMEGGLSPTCHP